MIFHRLNETAYGAPLNIPACFTVPWRLAKGEALTSDDAVVTCPRCLGVMALRGQTITGTMLRDLISKSSFRDSTSPQYRHIPHSYIVHSSGCDNPAKASPVHDQLHAAMCIAICEHGFNKQFGKATYRYVRLGGFKYWIIEEILNRDYKL